MLGDLSFFELWWEVLNLKNSNYLPKNSTLFKSHRCQTPPNSFVSSYCFCLVFLPGIYSFMLSLLQFLQAFYFCHFFLAIFQYFYLWIFAETSFIPLFVFLCSFLWSLSFCWKGWVLDFLLIWGFHSIVSLSLWVLHRTCLLHDKVIIFHHAQRNPDRFRFS